jgi:hypothetical protein
MLSAGLGAFMAKAYGAALVVHAAKHRTSKRTLYISPAIAVAKARGLFKAGWQVHVVDADGRLFHPEHSTSF